MPNLDVWLLEVVNLGLMFVVVTSLRFDINTFTLASPITRLFISHPFSSRVKRTIGSLRDDSQRILLPVPLPVSVRCDLDLRPKAVRPRLADQHRHPLWRRSYGWRIQMNAVRQQIRPRHQVLVLKCYPKFQKNVQEVKPNSSELSYLLYYASTRRSKLQKVGTFLEKRTAIDVRKLKLGFVYYRYHH